MSLAVEARLRALRPQEVPRRLDIHLLSDTAAGRGEGFAGVVDIDVEHDVHGFPFLGGKTLHGVLRDSWLRLADQFPDLHEAALAVLGTGGALAEDHVLRIGDAVLDPRLEATVAAWATTPGRREAVLSAHTVVRTQTARARTGEPERGSLRAVRAVRRGLVLHSPLRWASEPEASSDELLVLVLAARASRALGLSRSRGLGRVRIEPRAEPIPVPSRPPAEQSKWSDDAFAGSVTYLPIQLTLRAPAIITAMGGGGAIRTQDHVPGSSLQGIVAWRVREDSTDEAAAQAKLDDLVFSDDIAFLDALVHPVAAPSRGLAAPSGWRRTKDDLDAPLQDVAVLAGNGEVPENTTSVAGRWCFDEASAARIDIRGSARLHNARDRVAGRAWTTEAGEGRGAMFSYEALHAGQRFTAHVALRGEADQRRRRAGTLRDLLDRDVLVGRSRQAGYGGQAAVLVGAPQRSLDATEPVLREDVQAGDRFRALLLSSYVGRDPGTGQLDPSWLGHELEHVLGQRARVVQVIGRVERIGGFNRQWGLPTPIAPAVSAGGEVVLEAEERIPYADLEVVAAEGIGEQRDVGHGRLAWRWADPGPDGDAPRLEVGAPIEPVEAGLPDAASIREMLLDLESRLAAEALRRRVAERSRELSFDEGIREMDLPPPSLLGRIRTALLAANRSAELGDWLGDGEGALRAPARTKLRRLRLALPTGKDDPRQVTLLELLRQLADPQPREVLDRALGLDDMLAQAVVEPDGRLREAVDAQLPAVARAFALALLTQLGVRAALSSGQREEGGR